ncbi:MAG: hypothetical protein WB562_20885 [Candidatus Sulfotelmatobacter sp.]
MGAAKCQPSKPLDALIFFIIYAMRSVLVAPTNITTTITAFTLRSCGRLIENRHRNGQSKIT